MTVPAMHQEVIARLRQLLARSTATPMDDPGPVLLSATGRVATVDPLLLYRRARGRQRVFWERAMEGFALLGIGAAAELSGRGEASGSQVASAWHDLASRAVVEVGDDYPLAAPVCLGGFAFDAGRRRDHDWMAYPDGLLLLPRVLFTWAGESCWLTVNLLRGRDAETPSAFDTITATVAELLGEDRDQAGDHGQEPRARTTATRGQWRLDWTLPAREGTDDTTIAAGPLPRCGLAQEDGPAASGWREAVLALVDDIRRGRVEKQVLARRVAVHVGRPSDPGVMLERLRHGYGGACTVFAVDRADRCFLGASPERLVRVDGRIVRADCLAGSTARGRTAEEDLSLGMALLADRKERHEHALVVRALRETLAPVCERLAIPNEPTLVRMPNVQHLHTPAEGLLRSGDDILDLVRRLHPTPAAAGAPRAGILSRIRAYESFDRGWYAGPVGWVDGRGGGEFAVAIRSALVKGIARPGGRHPTSHGGGSEILVYAGCGIVADSDPDAEYRESCLKLSPLLWAIGGVPGDAAARAALASEPMHPE